jgi:hypothetical protein
LVKSTKGELLDVLGGEADNVGYGQQATIITMSQSLGICTGPLNPENKYYLDLWTVYEIQSKPNVVYQENILVTPEN